LSLRRLLVLIVIIWENYKHRKGYKLKQYIYTMKIWIIILIIILIFLLLISMGLLSGYDLGPEEILMKFFEK